MQKSLLSGALRCALGAGMIAGLAIVASPLTSSSAQAADEAEGALLVVQLFGSRGWKVECALEKESGKMIKPKARGRGSNSSGSIIGRDVVGGTCQIDASSGYLRVTIVDRTGVFQCPFENTAADACEATYPAGTTTSIQISQS